MQAESIVYIPILYILCRGAANRSRDKIAEGNPRQVMRMGWAVYINIGIEKPQPEGLRLLFIHCLPF